MSDGAEAEIRAGDMSAGGAEDEPIADRESRLSLSIAEISHLLSLARDSVAHAARGAEFVCPDDLWPENLKACCGAFVTIRCGEELRGCVGFNRPLFPLAETVIRAARGAVLDDCRFSPVEAHEIGSLTIEISVLTESRPASIDEIVIGRHGIIVSRGPRRGLLLPQVAVEHGWTPQRFLSETCRKAGLAPDAWNHGATVEIFEAFVCSGPA